MSRPKRLPTFDYRGPHVYALTFCTSGRRPHFQDATLVARVRASMAQSAAERRFAILAFTFMPDHLHLLVQGTDEGSMLGLFVKLARQRSAIEASRCGFGRLWQDGYFEHTLRADADVVAMARYIAANPVRAGLAGEAHEWPYSGGSLVEALFQRGRCP